MKAQQQLTPLHCIVTLAEETDNAGTFYPVLWKGWSAKQQSNAVVVALDHTAMVNCAMQVLTPFDDDGGRLVMVPDAQIERWYTEEEAASAAEAQAADEHLLQCAR